MVWLFKCNEVFWGDKPKVNDYFILDTNDIETDLTKYDISLYFGLANYYLLSDDKDGEIYNLRFISTNGNPMRVLISEDSEIHSIIRNFYLKTLKEL
jgi:hypothetical protein